jgi:signal transduction histidine kinase/putative methionine-R-sulfoxide reductase with GAF domain
MARALISDNDCVFITALSGNRFFVECLPFRDAFQSVRIRGIRIIKDMGAYRFKQKSKLRDEHAIIILLIIAGLSAYLLDVAVDTFVYHFGPFLDVLTSASPALLSARLYILASFVILGIFIYGSLANRRNIEERLSALNFYGGKLNTAKDVQGVYELTVDAMEKTLGFEYAAFMVGDRSTLKVACYRGRSEPQLRELPIGGAKGVTVRAMKTGAAILVPDVSRDKEYVAGYPGIRSELAVPVAADDKILGVLNVESSKKGAFSQRDATLLQVLASHAGTAISNILRRGEIEKRSDQMALLLKSSAEIIHSASLRRRLQTIAEAIRDLGWRRVVISVRDKNMEMRSPDDLVTVGITIEEREHMWNNRPPGSVVSESFGPEYERLRIGEFYYSPWSDPWVRERQRSAGNLVESHLKAEDMIDWDPQDMLYAPLRLADGRIVGRLVMDDPMDGKKPTLESLRPLELFLSQAAVAIENAQLIQQLNDARAKLEEYADHLEAKVEERTRELKEAQNRLLKSERLAAIGELAGMVGHDLRNPLTGMTGAAYYLKNKVVDKTNDKAREMLVIIEKNIAYSNKIINDLLDYSREIRLELVESSPKAIVEEALSLVKIPRNVKVLDLTENEPKVEVDVDKLKRAFVNIIKNAVEAMPKGGKLTIKSKRSNDGCEIAFSDTGTGMTDRMLQNMWSPLYTTKAKGMGFGLPICKRIVEAHGGKIAVETAVAKGTTFTISIPINQQKPGEVCTFIQESTLQTITNECQN